MFKYCIIRLHYKNGGLKNSFLRTQNIFKTSNLLGLKLVISSNVNRSSLVGANPSVGSHHLLTAVHCMIISVVGVVELLRLDAQPQCLESGCATVWKCSGQALIGFNSSFGLVALCTVKLALLKTTS